MTEFTADLANQVLEVCQQNAATASALLSRALDAPISIESAAAAPISAAELPLELRGPALVLVFRLGSVGAAFCIPQATGLLPLWYSSPDGAGESKLAALAQEFSSLLLPEPLVASGSEAGKVDDLPAALAQGKLDSNSAAVQLTLSSGGRQAVASLVWPLAQPDAVLPPRSSEPHPAVTSGAPHRDVAPHRHDDDFSNLPRYTRSLLRVRVPVRVNLAAKKESVRSIVELGAGAIIRFNKPCEETLELEVGGHPIARGEAVKVGDMFGLRITSMILPEERFTPLAPPAR